MMERVAGWLQGMVRGGLRASGLWSSRVCAKKLRVGWLAQPLQAVRLWCKMSVTTQEGPVANFSNFVTWGELTTVPSVSQLPFSTASGTSPWVFSTAPETRTTSSVVET